MQHPPIARTGHKTMRRIAATLNACADLAEHASLLPLPVVWVVLWILRPAEAIARDFAVQAAHDLYMRDIERLCPSAIPIHGDLSAQAVRLAIELRMLAAIVSELAVLAGSDTADTGYRVPVAIGAGTLFIAVASSRALPHRQCYQDSS